MRSANGMKSIVEGIAASYESRVKATRDRMEKVRELTGNAQKTVRDFASARKHMGTGQVQALAEYAGILRQATGGMIRSFQKDHAERAAALKEALAHGETARVKSFKDMMADIREVIKEVEKSVQDIKAHVADKLAQFSGARAGMSRELRKDLAKYAADIDKQTKAVLGEARGLVHGFARERTLLSAEWQGMAAAMAKKKGAQAPTEAKPTSAQTEEAKPKRKSHRKRSRKSA